MAWAAGALVAFFILVLAWPMDARRYLRPEASPEVVDRGGRTLHVFLRPDQQWCMVRELKRVSPWLVKATVAAEDQRFYSHMGVDPVAVGRAAVQNVRGRRAVSGASTLSMQVIKLTDGPAGSIFGKVGQAISAVRLDLRADKDEILTAYLNRAAYGLNLIGCEAASRRYFGKPSSELTLPEAALLAGLPRAPSHLMPLEHAKKARVRRNWVLRRMRDEGMIAEGEYKRAVAAPVVAKRHAFPAYAPHLACRIQPKPGAPPTTTTLDLGVQAGVEKIVRQHVAGLGPAIHDAAAIVLDARDASVLAWVGSPNFLSEKGGQVDAAIAPRAPGSTLKPFTYGLAIQQGLLWPREALLDDTLNYGLYQPRNFSQTHRGLVGADDALRLSLNVPAVIVFNRLSEGAVLEFLRGGGMTTFNRTAQVYGLGLALGSCEARLDQLAGMYCMLASLGQWRPLHWTPAVKIEPKPMLSRGVCLGLYQMMRQPFPRAYESLSATDTQSPVCWKTGTSTGFHDAWTFAFNRHYVVGVWVGNVDGKPAPDLVGVRVALPLAAKIFRSLPARSDPPWPEFTDEFREVEVCAMSGLPASPWCPHKRKDLVPRELTMARTCDVHWPGLDGQVVERWPGAARGWDLAKIDAPSPALALNSELRTQDSALRELRILDPAADGEYTLTGEPNGDKLRVKTSLPDERLYWYVDDRYLGESTPEKPLMLDLTEGTHKLACIADDGRISTTSYTVGKPNEAPKFEE
ncbi:penicillin-binding protein 1C [bacterium]|nr:penicillin-binding protein 1C [bacterium]